MTLVELANLLDSLGYPVAYSHFKSKQDTPFICYLENNDSNFTADNKVYHKIKNVSIELYTSKKDEIIEAKIETLLDENEIPYDSYGVFIESENLFQKTYEVRMI